MSKEWSLGATYLQQQKNWHIQICVFQMQGCGYTDQYPYQIRDAYRRPRRATLEIKSGDSKSHVFISCCKLVEGIPGSGYNNNDSIDKYNNPVYEPNQADDNRSSQQRQHSQLSTTDHDSTRCNIKKKHRSNQLRYHNRHQWWIINQTTKTLEIRIVLSAIAFQAQILTR
jgi:hypothetical protein